MQAGSSSTEQSDDAEVEGGATAAPHAVSYDYLLSMAIWSLTFEKVVKLQEEAAVAAAEVTRLEAADIRQMWDDDLEAFLEVRVKCCSTQQPAAASVSLVGFDEGVGRGPI